MKYYVVKDGEIIGEASSHKAAIDLVRAYQSQKTHYLLQAQFSIIKEDPQEFVNYPRK